MESNRACSSIFNKELGGSKELFFEFCSGVTIEAPVASSFNPKSNNKVVIDPSNKLSSEKDKKKIKTLGNRDRNYHNKRGSKKNTFSKVNNFKKKGNGCPVSFSDVEEEGLDKPLNLRALHLKKLELGKVCFDRTSDM